MLNRSQTFLFSTVVAALSVSTASGDIATSHTANDVLVTSCEVELSAGSCESDTAFVRGTDDLAYDMNSTEATTRKSHDGITTAILGTSTNKSLDETEAEEDHEYEEDDYYYEEEEVEPGSEFGVVQVLQADGISEEEAWAFLDTVEEYMEEHVWERDFYIQFPKTCWNENELCTIWALEGECDDSEEFMLESCRPSCFACDDEEGAGSSFGATQILEHEEVENSTEIVQKLQETQDYVFKKIMEDAFYEKVRGLCYNRHELCTVWAVQGYCHDETEQDYMFHACAPACGKCEQLHYDTRCPVDPEEFPDILKPGDINKLFERIVSDNETYKVNVWSRPDYLPGDDEDTADYEVGPWIITIDDFISNETADRLISWGTGRYERSEEVGGVDEETGEALEAVVSTDRTSTNAWCQDECELDPVVVDLFRRVEQMTGVPPENSESLQLLKYEPGEYYLTHHDYVPGSDNEPGGPRILTVYIYLNDVEEGGGTRFDWFDMVVVPKRGSVAIWPSVLDEDPTQKDERTEHEAMPVIKGIKYGANAWLHLRNFSKAGQIGC